MVVRDVQALYLQLDVARVRLSSSQPDGATRSLVPVESR
jgi:hypothetical protein